MKCSDCRHFQSYKSVYEDELEPDDCGFCREGKIECHVSADEKACSLFKKQYSYIELENKIKQMKEDLKKIKYIIKTDPAVTDTLWVDKTTTVIDLINNYIGEDE